MKRIRPTLVTLFIAAAAVVSAFMTPLPARAANATAVKPLQSVQLAIVPNLTHGDISAPSVS